jgi:hypothetical protein
VSGSVPSVHRLHAQHGVHENSIIGYIPAANANTAQSGSKVGSAAIKARRSI